MCSGVYSLPSSPRSPSVSQSYHLTICITKILRAYSNETVIIYFTIDGRYMRAQSEERTGVRLTVFGDVLYTGVSVAFDGQASTWLGMWGLLGLYTDSQHPSHKPYGCRNSQVAHCFLTYCYKASASFWMVALYLLRL